MTDFNCTIQELKLSKDDFDTIMKLHFNCTIQELKHQIRQRTGGAGAFQLHHTGIKTPYIDKLIKDYIAFQLHHTGIKTDNLAKRDSKNIISIAPYRN